MLKARRRKADLDEKKFHVPMADKEAEEPPFLVAVHGPPGVRLLLLV